MLASAGVLSAFTFATSSEIELEAEVLGLGLGSLFQLNDEGVAFSLGEFCFTYKGVTFLLEVEFRLAGFGIRLYGGALGGGGDGLEIVIVEVDRHGAILLDHELGVGLRFIEEAPTSGPAFMVMIVFIGCAGEKGAG